MALFTTLRTGLTNTIALTQQLVEDLTDHGFSVIYPLNYVPSERPSVTTLTVTLVCTPDADPLANTQPWTITLWAENSVRLRVFVSTPLQITSTTGLPATIQPSGFNGTDSRYYAGEIANRNYNTAGSGPDINADPSFCFLHRFNRNSAFPMNYRLTVTSYGVFVGVYEGNWSSLHVEPGYTINNYFNWFLVQRPVNKTTGAPLITGKCPVFAMSGVNNMYRRLVVREADIPHPAPSIMADISSEDGFKLINSQIQNAVTENKKYIISFPSNLNTPRFRYTEELDMIAITSADVVSEGTNITLDVYGEERVYTALPCNRQFNTGMRPLVLTNIIS